MSEITHQKARLLLQQAADQMLRPEDKPALDMHLANCKECSAYASNLSALETRLRNAFHANWDKLRLPNLNLQTVINPPPAKLLWNNFFSQSGAMGKVSIIAALLLGYFLLSNILGIQTPIVNNKTATTLPTPNEFTSAYFTSPTPSAPISLTGSTSQACETITYRVQKNDTLASIAFHYGITEETILEYNKSISTTVFNNMELVIPMCKSTPSHTATIPKNGLTITPANGTLFPTQPQ